MPGPLNHSPADVLRWALVQQGVVTDPTLGTLQTWPAYVASEPSAPDDVVTLYDTAGVLHGREHVSGETQEHHGVQVRVRSADHPSGWAKARAVAQVLDTGLYQSTVTIGPDTYLLHAVTRTTDVIALGVNVPDTRRDLFTINALISLRAAT